MQGWWCTALSHFLDADTFVQDGQLCKEPIAQGQGAGWVIGRCHCSARQGRQTPKSCASSAPHWKISTCKLVVGILELGRYHSIEGAADCCSSRCRWHSAPSCQNIELHWWSGGAPAELPTRSAHMGQPAAANTKHCPSTSAPGISWRPTIG